MKQPSPEAQRSLPQSKPRFDVMPRFEFVEVQEKLLVGCEVGFLVGILVGFFVGGEVGFLVGFFVGCLVGKGVGCG
jgi:hypothetical protein